MARYVMRVLLGGIENRESDIVRALIFVTAMAMNVEHVAYDAATAWRFADALSPPSDDMRIPVGVRAVSDRLGMPYETTRRHLIRMVEIGRAAKVGHGLIIPSTVNQESRYLRVGLNIYLRLLRAVSQIERLGFDIDSAVA